MTVLGYLHNLGDDGGIYCDHEVPPGDGWTVDGTYFGWTEYRHVDGDRVAILPITTRAMEIKWIGRDSRYSLIHR